MEWRDRIARGFSPGRLSVHAPPWKWRPTWSKLIGAFPANLRAKPSHYFGRPYRASNDSQVPRAKALGYSISPFHGVDGARRNAAFIGLIFRSLLAEQKNTIGA